MTARTPAPAGAGRSRTWVVPVAIAAGLALVYLLSGLRSGDLAAHDFRADLFDREGFSLWNGRWFGGHHTPAYSVLFPPLAGLLGPRAVGALAVVAATALFERLEAEHFGDRARHASIWFGAASVTLLLTGRLTFALGLAFGLAAVLAAGRGRTALTAVLSLLAALASPVAGAFLGLAGLATFLAGRRPAGAALAGGGLAPVLALSAAFPEGGWQPFTLLTVLPALALAIAALLVLPPQERELRIAAALYAPATVGAYLLHTPMGSNAIRLYELFAVPLFLVFLASRPTGARRALAIVAVIGFAYLQWHPAIRDVVRGIEDDAYDRAYYDPLLDYLERDLAAPARGRVEIPPTRSHFEAAEVAPHFTLARGWQRQLDVGRNELFYDGSIDARSYARWLRENAVHRVAVAGAPQDFGAEDELRLIASGLPYLREVASPGDWTVYRVLDPRPVVDPDGRAAVRLEQLGRDRVALRFDRPGSALVRVRWTPLWRARGACVERAGDWTRVESVRRGRVVMGIDLDPARLLGGGRRCG